MLTWCPRTRLPVSGSCWAGCSRSRTAWLPSPAAASAPGFLARENWNRIRMLFCQIKNSDPLPNPKRNKNLFCNIAFSSYIIIREYLLLIFVVRIYIGSSILHSIQIRIKIMQIRTTLVPDLHNTVNSCISYRY